MELNYRLIKPPVVEPVLLPLAKQHLKVDFADDDNLIPIYISAARQYAERYTRRAFFPQTWLLTLDHFPYWHPGTRPMRARWDWYSQSGCWEEMAIRLPRPRCLSVTSIQYADQSNTQQTLDPASYVVDLNSEPARIVPVANTIWPFTQQFYPGSVQITFVAGTYAVLISDSLQVAGGAVTLSQEPVSTITVALPGGSSITQSPSGSNTVEVASADGTQITASYFYAQIPPCVVNAILLVLGHLYDNRDLSTENMPKGVRSSVQWLLDSEKHETFGYEV